MTSPGLEWSTFSCKEMIGLTNLSILCRPGHVHGRLAAVCKYHVLHVKLGPQQASEMEGLRHHTDHGAQDKDACPCRQSLHQFIG